MFAFKPLTAVVIPAFNRRVRLQAAINSVLNQTYTNYKLVVVNDASTTDLTDCKKLISGSGHCWIDAKQNGGPGVARNTGADALTFDWITFLDSDDIWAPEKLEKQMAWHASHPEFRISQVHESWFRNGVHFKKPAHLAQPGGEVFEHCVRRCAIGPSCVAIRSDLWQESGGFDPWYRVCEDYELWLRIAVREPVGLVEGDPLVEKHGGHSDQLSTCVAALDRFRFVALAQFLNDAKSSTPAQREMVTTALRKKAKILAKGAARRNRSDWETWFNELEIPLKDSAIKRAKIYSSIAEEGT